jgi:putative endonuclease
VSSLIFIRASSELACPDEARRRRDSGSRIMKYYYVYILASKKNGTLYIGVTSDLIKRVWEHKQDLVEGFTKKYQVHCLVYHEQIESIESAIVREKQLKAWKRKWKIELIEKNNQEWKDLYNDML